MGSAPVRRLIVEPLEDRLLLAGDVTAFINGAGDAVISGDSLGNTVLIRAGAAADQLVVDGKQTSVNGGGDATLNGFTGDVILNFTQGGDKATLRGLTLLPGQDVDANFGNAADRFNINNCTLQAVDIAALGGSDKLKFVETIFNGPFALDLGDGVNVLSTENVAFNGPSTFVSGAQDDTFKFADTTFNAQALVQSGAGSDRMRILRGGVFASFQFDAGSEDDVLYLLRTNVNAQITMNGGGGLDCLLTAMSNINVDPITNDVEVVH